MTRYKEIGAGGSIDSTAGVKGFASVEVRASRLEVWDALVRARDWPDWNKEIKSVSVDTSLATGKKFIWGPGFPKIKSEVVLCIPEEKLVWIGTMLHIKAIHVWKLEGNDSLTLVSTEESLHGSMVTWIFGDRKLKGNLENWLAALKRKVEMPAGSVSSD